MNDIPYIGFGNDTLNKLPKVKAGDVVECLRCGQDHILLAPDSGEAVVLFYHCGSKTYLGAISGKLVAGVRPDVSSSRT